MSEPEQQGPTQRGDGLRWQEFSKAELEREYSPSSAVGGNYQPFIEAYGSLSAASRSRCEHAKTLRYGELDSNLIDFVPAVAGNPAGRSPLLVFIHGGYWQEGSRTDSLFGADYFTEQGIAYAAVGYSLAPGATLPQMVNECRQAVAHLKDNAAALGIDASNIVIAGSSAGAQLAAMCCVTDAFLDSLKPPPNSGLVLLSGVFDLEPLVSTYVNDALGMTLQEAKHMSPMRHSLVAFPDTIVSWGENETEEFKRQSRAFAKALRANKVVIHQFESPQRNHFDIVHNLAENQSEIGRRVMSMLINKT